MEPAKTGNTRIRIQYTLHRWTKTTTLPPAVQGICAARECTAFYGLRLGVGILGDVH